MIKLMWSKMYECWRIRCEHQHESDNKQQDMYRHKELIQQVSTLYSLAPALKVQDRTAIFRMELKEILDKPTRYLEVWTTTYAHAITVALKQA